IGRPRLDPLLIGSDRLRVHRRATRRSLAPVAFALLVAALAGAGVWQSLTNRTADPSAVASPVAPSGSATRVQLPGVPIPGTSVPVPPRSFHLRPSTSDGGKGTWDYLSRSTAPMTATEATRLFEFYVRAMPQAGWQLVTKAD